jgi:hypothetical protein
MMSKWLERQQLLEEEERRKSDDVIEKLFSGPMKPIAAPADPASTYHWVKHDNIWDVARRLGYDSFELMEHNNLSIARANELKPGDSLHLPIPRELKEEKLIRYEILTDPLPMHVSKPGGCKKWSFGNADTWDEFLSAGFFPENTNLKIVAIANVPITEKDGSETEAHFYMDDLSFGDYAETGRVRYTIGYGTGDLSEGHVDFVGSTMKNKKIVINADNEPMPKLGNEGSTIARLAATYQGLNPPIFCTVHLPEGVESIDIIDYGGQRPNRKCENSREIVIAGTFQADGFIMGRPAIWRNKEWIATPYWFGIKMDYLISDGHLYNTKSDAQTRADSGGPLSWSERNVWIPIAKFVHNPRFKQLKNRIQNKNNKEK